MRGAPVLALALALAGCAGTPEAPPPAPPTLETPALTLADQSFSSLSLELGLPVHNPAGEAATVQGARWRLRTGQRPLGEGEARLEAPLPPQATTPVVLPLAIERLWTAEERAALGDAFPVVVEGELTVTGAFGDPVVLPFARAITVRTPRLPAVEVAQAAAARRSSERVDLSLRLQVVNDNPFPLRLRYLAHALSVEGAVVHEERGLEGQTVPSASALEVGIEVTLTPATVPGLEAALAADNALDYRLEGTLQAGDLAVPVRVEDRVVFSLDR